MRLAGVAVLAMLAGVTATAVDGPVWGAWVTETVDLDLVFPRSTYPVVTDDGIAVLYFKSNIYSAAYLALGSHPWEFIHVEEQTSLGDLKVDASGTFHMLTAGANLRYWRYSDSGLVGETILQNNGWPNSPQLALDSAASPHVLYAFDGNVYYARKDPGWTSEIIGAGTRFIDITLDSNDRVHAVYTLSGTESRYATRDSAGVWTVESLLPCRSFVAIALDSDDVPHVACSISAGLIHKWKENGIWHQELVDDGGFEHPSKDIGWDIQMAIDSQDRIHVAYRARTNGLDPDDPFRLGHPRYALKAHGVWWVETIDRDGTGTGFGTGIALDADDRPHVTYVQGWRSDRLVGMGYCDTAVNPCFDLRYARPPLAAASRAATSALGTIG